jgi:uracil-DNA glycosylase
MTVSLSKIQDSLTSVDPSWIPYLKNEFEQDYFHQIEQKLNMDYQKNKIIYPDLSHVMRAFQLTKFNQIKVVILGQDPYHGPNQAQGLAFSVPREIKLPPSLKNIFKELASDLQIKTPLHGDLSSWAQQGVLLLNTTLTVEQGHAFAHAKYGWQIFTDRVIEIISQEREHVIFLLWGAPAQNKLKLIDQKRHHVLMAPHPSPLSAHRGFLGCRHFSQVNTILNQNNNSPIQWDTNI